jgi:replicative DNA helicase
MDFETLKNEIHNHAKYYLQKDKSGKGYICPICNSGSGKNGTGISTKDNIHFTCWAGCFTSTDIIDIIGMQYGLYEYKDKIEKACDLMNIPIYEQTTKKTTAANIKKDNTSQNVTQSTETPQKEILVDYRAFYTLCKENAHNSEYLTNRGISYETQQLYNIGYCGEWVNPKNENSKPTPRVIIPTSDNTYVSRYAGDEEFFNNNCKVIKVGSTNIFNTKALYSGYKPVFICEGEIDALSVIELGYEAVGLGGTNMWNKLVKQLEERPTQSILILSLDNDDAGIKATNSLKTALNDLGILYIEHNISSDYKDPNEALLKDKIKFKNDIEEALKKAAVVESNLLKELQQAESCEHYIDDFIDGIEKSVDTPFISTGFSGLDYELDGGLYEGFYVLGAISSLGKTTLALQIADNIAAADDNTDVLIFSLEMARNELIAKSLRRQTLMLAKKKGLPIDNAKTTRQITVKRFYNRYSETEKQLINDACKEYKKFSKNIYIYEGVGNIAAEQIRQTIERHKNKTERFNRKIVAIIDYLQILAPFDEKSRTDKQNIDLNITSIKRICRDMKCSIIGISSLNRGGYNEAVNMASFKESGSIEYSCDVLMGLQLKGIGDSDFNVDKAKQQNPRELILRILKNRNGKTGGEIEFTYYPQYNYFNNKQDWHKADNTPFKR